jgi:hypothetical protein
LGTPSIVWFPSSGLGTPSIVWFPSSGLGTLFPEALLRMLGSRASRLRVPKPELGNEWWLSPFRWQRVIRPAVTARCGSGFCLSPP